MLKLLIKAGLMTKQLLLDQAGALGLHPIKGQMTLVKANGLFYISPSSHDTRYSVCNSYVYFIRRSFNGENWFRKPGTWDLFFQKENKGL